MNETSGSIDMAYNETNACSIHANFGIFIVYITAFITFMSVSECLVVILVIWFTETLRGNTNVFVASLAVNDLLLAVAFTSNQITVVPLGVSYSINSKLLNCFTFGISSATTNLSLMHMGVIAVDRFIQIDHPFYYMKAMTKKRSYSVVLVLWITNAIFIIIPPTVYYDDKYHRECILLHQPVVYYCSGASVYFTSLILVFFCYLKIAHVAFKHKKAAESRRLAIAVPQADLHLRNNVHTALRSVKFFALMFGVFFMCTFPPVFTTGLGLWHTLPENIYVGLFSLVPLHSTINFLIFTYMNKEFSSALVRKVSAIKRRFCKHASRM